MLLPFLTSKLVNWFQSQYKLVSAIQADTSKFVNRLPEQYKLVSAEQVDTSKLVK